MDVQFSWEAHTGRVIYMHQLKQRNALLTFGEEEDGAGKTAVLRMWDLEKRREAIDTAEGTKTGLLKPPCIRVTKIFSNKFPEAEVTAFSLLEESASQLVVAFGLANGTVYYLRGDVARDRVKQGKITLVPSPGEAPPPPGGVTGLHLHHRHLGDTAHRESDGLFMYASTREALFLLVLGRPGQVSVLPLDDIGVLPRCTALNTKGELLVARPEAVYCYDADGRGPCFAFDGQKRLIASTKAYLAVVSSGGAGTTGSVDDLTIYDVRNKVIAYRKGIGEVDHVIFEWGLVVIVTPRRIFCLRERPSSERLDMLFKKGLYNIAISIAAADGGDVAEVQKRYGDHLYQKKDYEGAMSHYCLTIGSLEPSYVIRKYLDTQRIHSLTSYLEQLHSKEVASGDHTTLLLNCYTKLKDVQKLDDFLRHGGGASTSTDLHLRFDVETAVKVLRAAEYYDHALAVAERAAEHELYVTILLEDLKRYADALAYIRQLKPWHAAAELRRYGKVLVTALPDDTTSLLMYLCTVPFEEVQEQGENTAAATTTTTTIGEERGLPPPGLPVELGRGGGVPRRPRATEFIHCFVDKPISLVVFLEFIMNTVVAMSADESRVVYITLLDLYLTPAMGAMGGGGRGGRGGSGEALGGLQEGAGEVELEVEVEETEQAAESRSEKALGLLKAGWSGSGGEFIYDADEALLLCQMRCFRPGLLFLYEHMGMHLQLIQVYKEEGDHEALLKTVKRLDASTQGGNPQLWINILEYFASLEEGACSRELGEAIAYIEGGNLLPPLIVLQTLAKGENITVGVVKDYIARALEAQTSIIEDDCRAIQQYQSETARMKAEVEEMRTQAKVFQLNKCSICSTPLDLPAVHFLCMHSFHQRCLGENEWECPVCGPKQRQVAEIRHNLAASVQDHDKFYQQLRNSGDGFEVVADYFSRGLFGGMKERAP